jgi:hypothetical protein
VNTHARTRTSQAEPPRHPAHRQGGRLGDARAFQVELFSADSDDLNLEKFDWENARVRAWMDHRPDGVKYCFELNAIHEDLDWLLSEWDTDVGVRYNQEYFDIGGFSQETQLFVNLDTFHQHESREMREVIKR